VRIGGSVANAFYESIGGLLIPLAKRKIQD